MLEKYDHTTKIMCPHCGYEDTDSWESTGGQEEIQYSDCGSCGEKFLFMTEIFVRYSSWIPHKMGDVVFFVETGVRATYREIEIVDTKTYDYCVERHDEIYKDEDGAKSYCKQINDTIDLCNNATQKDEETKND